MSEERMVFDSVSVREVGVSIAGEEYVLRQASSAVAAKYRSATARCMRAVGDTAGGRVDLTNEGVGDVQPLLVSWCLFKVLDGGRVEPMRVEVIREWDDVVTTALYEKVKEMSPSIQERVKQKEFDGASKNSRNAGLVGSA